jgi:hypothetical protein
MRSPAVAWLPIQAAVAPCGAAPDVPTRWKALAGKRAGLPRALRFFFDSERQRFLKDPEGVLARDAGQATTVDRALMTYAPVHAMLREAQLETWRQGIEVMVERGVAVALTWGFSPAQVSVPAHVWHGTSDPEIPSSMAGRLVAELPDGHLTLLSEEGQLLLFSHWSEILRDLVS